MTEVRININEWIRRVRGREVECLNHLPEDEKEEKYALHLKVLQKHSAVFKIVIPQESRRLNEIDEVKRKIQIAEDWFDTEKYQNASPKIKAQGSERYAELLKQLAELEEGLI